MSHPQFAEELIERAKEKGPIVIGLAGAGQMGTDIVVQVALMPGIRIGAISEIRPEAAIDAAILAGHDRSDVVEANSATAIDVAIEAGKLAVTQDLNALGGRRPGGCNHRRHRQPQHRHAFCSGGNEERKAHRHAQRRGGHYDRPLPQGGGKKGRSRLYRRGRRRARLHARDHRIRQEPWFRHRRGRQRQKQPAEGSMRYRPTISGRRKGAT